MIKAWKQLIVLCTFLSISFLFLAAPGPSAGEARRITKEEVKAGLDKSDVIVIDVRTAADWDSSKSKIKGAVREDPTNVPAWNTKYPKDKRLVLYCA